jgi:hypothetical protein
VNEPGLGFDAEGYLEDSPVRPEVALALWYAAGALVERSERDRQSLAGGLPPIAKTWVDQPQWVDRLAACYRMVRDRLAVAAFPIARCTGEEFALHMTIAAASQLTAEGLGPDPALYGMQVMGEPDTEDFATAHLDLFEDKDLMFLLLFEPVFDGIEDSDGADNQRLGIGPYLHPNRWFHPFPGYEGGTLERLELVVEADDDVIWAASELALNAGARGMQVVRDGSRWLARAQYPGRELVGEGEDPQSAATALVRLLLEASRCPSCGHGVTIDPGGPDELCRWARVGRRWLAGCE